MENYIVGSHILEIDGIMEMDIYKRLAIFTDMDDLTEVEKLLIYISVYSVNEQLKFESTNISKLPFTMMLIHDKKEFTFRLDDLTAGCLVHIILCPFGSWRKSQHPDVFKMSIIIEELCHQFWAINDEAIVKHKVLEIMNNHIFAGDAKISLGQVFNEEWIKEYEYRRDNGLPLKWW